jgi:hypothetical protein
MLNETHHAPPRYKIPEFFSSLLGLPTKPSVCLKAKGNPYFNEQSLQSPARHHGNNCIDANNNTVAMLNLEK